MGLHVHTASGSWSGMPVSATLTVDHVVLRLTHDTRTATCWAPFSGSVCARRLYSLMPLPIQYTSGTHNRNFSFACVVCWDSWVAERICLHGTLRNASHDSIRTERNGTERIGSERNGSTTLVQRQCCTDGERQLAEPQKRKHPGRPKMRRCICRRDTNRAATLLTPVNAALPQPSPLRRQRRIPAAACAPPATLFVAQLPRHRKSRHLAGAQIPP